MGTTDWTPAVGVLAAGLVTGGAAILLGRRRRTATAKAAPAAPPPEQRELSARRDVLVEQLREVNAAAGPAEDKARIELELAKVLRSLENAPSAPAPVAAPKAPAPASSSAIGLGFVLAGLACFGLLLGMLLKDHASPRMDGAMEAGMRAPMRPPQVAAAQDPGLAQLVAFVQANPDRLDAKLELAGEYMARGELFEGFKASQEVLKLDPGNAQALSFQSTVRLAMGQAGVALETVDKALAKDPKLADAWARRGMILIALERPADAAASFEKASALDPENAALYRDKIAEVLAQAGGKPPAAGALPPNHPKAAALPANHPKTPDDAEGASPGPATTGPVYRVSVSLDPSVQGLPPNALVFVIVRPEGMTAGPPSAVRRLPLAALPVTLSLSASDSMTGAPLPERANVEARADADGNAMTKDPSDPIARVSGIAAGSALTPLTLRRP